MIDYHKLHKLHITEYIKKGENIFRFDNLQS